MSQVLEQVEDEASQASAKDNKAVLSAFDAEVKGELNGREAWIAKLVSDELDEDARTVAVTELLAGIQRTISEAGCTLQEAHVDLARKRLKAQAVTFALKLETSRTAGDVALTNQKAENDAVHEKQMQTRIRELTSSEGSLLEEARAMQDELQQKLDAANINAKSLDEALSTMQKKFNSAEERAGKVEEHAAKIKEESDAAQTALRDALKDLEGTRNENQSLGGQIKEMVDAYNEAIRSQQALREQLDAADARNEQFALGAEQAAAEAERVAISHAAELLELRESLAVQVEEAASAAAASERAAGDARVAAVHGELEEMRGVQTSLMQELDGMRAELEGGRGTIEELKEELQKERDAAAAAGAGSALELVKLKSQVGALQEELDSARGEVAKTLAELNIKLDENMTLAEQVQQLAQQHDEARAEIAQSTKQLEDALSDLNLTKSENQTLGEKIAELVRRHDAAQAMIAHSNEQLETAMRDLNMTRTENQTLGERVAELVRSHQTAVAEAAKSKAILDEAMRDMADLNSLKQENLSLSERVTQLVRQYEAARNENSAANAKLGDALKQVGVLTGDRASLSEQLEQLLKEFNAMRNSRSGESQLQRELDEIKAYMKGVQASLGDALGSIDVLKDDKTRLSQHVDSLNDGNRKLSDQVADLVNAYKAAKAELERIQSGLDVALVQVGSLTGDKMQLSEQVAELVAMYQRSQEELAQIQMTCSNAFASIEGLTSSNKNLGEQVSALVEAHSIATKELERIRRTMFSMLEELGTLTGDKKQLSETVNDLVSQYQAAKAELFEINETLDGMLKFVGGLKKDKRKLSDVIKEMTDQYKASAAKLKAAEAETAKATEQASAADERIQQVAAESVRERQCLVQAALRSMNDLRSHVQHTASGVRLQHHDDADDNNLQSFVSWEDPSRWGAMQAKSKSMLISLQLPTVPPLDISATSPPPRRLSPTKPLRSSRLCGASPRVRRQTSEKIEKAQAVMALQAMYKIQPPPSAPATTMRPNYEDPEIAGPSTSAPATLRPNYEDPQIAGPSTAGPSFVTELAL